MTLTGARRQRVAWQAARAGLGAVALMAVGCSGPSEAKHPEAQRRDTTLRHETCDEQRGEVERLDANGDGRAELIIVREGGREVCRAADLNFDGRTDQWSKAGPDGKLARRESDFDWDGQIDEVALYRDGQLVELQRSFVAPGRIDTWHFYENGVVRRTERDADGDAVIDQWWEHPAEKPECPLVYMTPPGAAPRLAATGVDLCAAGYEPPPAPGSAASAPAANPAAPPSVPPAAPAEEKR